MPAVSPVMPVSASPHHDVAGQRHMRASFASASRLRWAVAASRTVARIPVTVGVLALVLSMGIYTGTLWHAADAVSDVLTPLSFGTPRLQDGRPWTFAIGAFVQSGPEWYVIAVTLCIGLAAYEKRIGSRRTAVALFGTQLAATLVTAALLWPRANESWAWAASLAHQVDVGISAGVLGVLGASTAIISHSWRRGVRLCALAYLSVMVLRSGLLPDVEQLLAFGSGVLLGPILAGRPPLPIRSPPSRRARGEVGGERSGRVNGRGKSGGRDSPGYRRRLRRRAYDSSTDARVCAHHRGIGRRTPGR